MAITPISMTPAQFTPSVPATNGVKSMGDSSTQGDVTATQALTSEQIEQTVDEIRKRIEPVAQNLQFSIEKDTGKTIVKLIDTSTKEVLRQIPSEELVAIARALGKSQSGLIERKA